MEKTGLERPFPRGLSVPKTKQDGAMVTIFRRRQLLASDNPQLSMVRTGPDLQLTARR
jgi:hypothetical protein